MITDLRSVSQNLAYDDHNIFAKILRRDIPTDIFYEDAFALAFPDIAPKAPIHLLVIPKGAYRSFLDFSTNATASEVIGFTNAIRKIVEKAGLHDQGFRLITNNGEKAGQEVFHFHVHVLGGKPLGSIL